MLGVNALCATNQQHRAWARGWRRWSTDDSGCWCTIFLR